MNGSLNGTDWVSQVAPRLPPFPRVVMELLPMLRDEKVSLEVLARVARNDPVISAVVLATANRMRRLRTLPDIKDPFVAATYVGLNKLRVIVITAGMNRFLRLTGAENFFFEHSLAVAIVANELAYLASVSPEDAYVAGILHDIGQLGFLMMNGEGYRPVLEQGSVQGNLLERERALFGIDHGEAGAKLASFWELPAEIVQAIAEHHQDHSDTPTRLSALLNLAETLTRGLDLPPSLKNRVTVANAWALEWLGLRWGMPEMRDCFGRAVARFRYAMREQAAR